MLHDKLQGVVYATLVEEAGAFLPANFKSVRGITLIPSTRFKTRGMDCLDRWEETKNVWEGICIALRDAIFMISDTTARHPFQRIIKITGT